MLSLVTTYLCSSQFVKSLLSTRSRVCSCILHIQVIHCITFLGSGKEGHCVQVISITQRQNDPNATVQVTDYEQGCVLASMSFERVQISMLERLIERSQPLDDERNERASSKEYTFFYYVHSILTTISAASNIARTAFCLRLCLSIIQRHTRDGSVRVACLPIRAFATDHTRSLGAVVAGIEK